MESSAACTGKRETACVRRLRCDLQVRSLQLLTIPNLFSGWSALESPNLGSFGISQVCTSKSMFCGLSLRPQTVAGYVSGSSIAAAALGLFHKGLSHPLFSLFFSCRHHNLGDGC
jgi:hypothetical protein